MTYQAEYKSKLSFEELGTWLNNHKDEKALFSHEKVILLDHGIWYDELKSTPEELALSLKQGKQKLPDTCAFKGW